MKLVIFDVDGTLVYSNGLDSHSFAIAYNEVFNKQLPSINWAEYPHVTDTVIFEHIFEKQFGAKPTLKQQTDFQDCFVDILKKDRVEAPNKFKQVPHAAKLIHRLLEEEDIIVGLATGGWQRPATLKLQHIGVSTEPIYDAYADGMYNRESIINHSIDKAKAAFDSIDKIVYVGDAKWDVTTTQNMNLPLIGIRVQGDVEYLHNMGIEHVLTGYEDYQGFLEIVNTIE